MHHRGRWHRTKPPGVIVFARVVVPCLVVYCSQRPIYQAVNRQKSLTKRGAFRQSPLAKASCDSPWDSEFIRAIPRPIILAGDIEHRLRNDAVEVFVAGTEDVRRDVDIAGSNKHPNERPEHAQHKRRSPGDSALAWHTQTQHRKREQQQPEMLRSREREPES